MITFPNAKINLGLNIVRKRQDGYHDLETVFYPIPVEDVLEVRPQQNTTQEDCVLHLSGLQVDGSDSDNLVVKTYRLLAHEYKLPPVEICLFKRIPFGAGLGGGSSDAAFMLSMLSDLFELKLSVEELECFAARLGADCAFFIQNRPVFATGVGNVFTPISLSLKGYQLYLIKPNIFVSTRDAFSLVKPCEPEVSLLDTIQRPVADWRNCMCNDFEQSVFARFPEIGRLKSQLYECGAVYASMSGSGSSVFGLFAPGTQLPAMQLAPDASVFKVVL